jgi:LuxR family maltose regulon positive regulatory protein
MESEFLARISQRQRTFLTRTSVLERMCGPLCETVLDLPGAGATLADASQSNLLVVPLDRRGDWYRYHHLFRDMLLAELKRLDPGLAPVLRRRAASWCLRNSLAEEALEYSIAAADVETAAHLVGQLCLPAYYQGRRETSQRWLQWLENQGGIEGHPMVAAPTAFTSVLLGRPVEAQRWAEVVDRWQYGDAARPADTAAGAWAALLRAILCRDGVEQMCTDADEAVHGFTAENIVQPGLYEEVGNAGLPDTSRYYIGGLLKHTPLLLALVCQGLARAVCGDLDSADESFQDAVSVAEQAGAYEALAVALSERSLLAMTRGQWDRAEILAGQAAAVIRRSGIEGAVPCTVLARAALHRGDLPAVRQHLVGAQRVRSRMTYAAPVLAVQVRIELIRVYLALADLAGARTLMQEIDELLRRRPALGTLVDEAQALRDRLANERGAGALGASALSAAELRLLPLLSTHLSFPEIAAELFVSRNTVKAQVQSIYRKLGASSRSGAVGRARELGLLEG